MHLALLLVGPHIPLDHYRDKDNLQAASCQSKLPREKPHVLLENEEEREGWNGQKRDRAEKRLGNFKRWGNHSCVGE